MTEESWNSDEMEDDPLSFECEFCMETNVDENDCYDETLYNDIDLELQSPHQNDPDKLTISLQTLIDKKKLTPDCFMYKFLTNISIIL